MRTDAYISAEAPVILAESLCLGFYLVNVIVTPLGEQQKQDKIRNLIKFIKNNVLRPSCGRRPHHHKAVKT